MTFSPPLDLFGFEAQPNTALVSTVTASFFSGMTLIGSIVQNVDGSGGARLFAAASTTPFDRVVLSSTDDLAVAQLRAGGPPPTATPTTTPTVTPTLTATVTPTATPAGAGGDCTTPAECTAGLFCVDGVCCTSACDAPAQACNIPPNPGTCTDVAAPAPAVSPLGLAGGIAALLLVAALALSRRGRSRTWPIVTLVVGVARAIAPISPTRDRHRTARSAST